MTVKVEAQGSSYEDCLRQLGQKPRAPIEVVWRTANYSDIHEPGGIVHVRGRAPKECTTSREVADYIASVTEAHDQWIERKRSLDAA